MNGESPFEPKNRQLARTPPSSEGAKKRPNTRSRSYEKASKTNIIEPKNNKTGVIEPKTNKTVVIEPKTNKTSVNEPENNKPKTTMNPQQIQQTIANFVPEFSGENSSTRNGELTRFINTANVIFEMLTTNDEIKTFERLIKLRLIGEAYSRISNRDIENYPAMREILTKMYAQPCSLDELERQFLNTKQTYGETIRNYGYRIIEALERYKGGFKVNYKVNAQIDNSYNQHLNESAINTFKRGLNNTILQERIATYKAKNIEELIDETEAVEKMLQLLTNPNQTHEQEKTKQVTPTQNKHQQPTYIQKPTVICNYCQKPNHTYDICRTRMQQERNQTHRNHNYNPYQNINYRNTHPNVHNQRPQNYHTIPNHQNPIPNQQKPYYQNHQNNHYQNHQNNHYQNHQNNQQTSHQFHNPRYNPNNLPPPKYCSFCKTTKSHTFEECRSKFFPPRGNQEEQSKGNIRPEEQQELNKRFENMRINMIYPHQEQNYGNANENLNQGNEQGSSQ